MKKAALSILIFLAVMAPLSAKLMQKPVTSKQTKQASEQVANHQIRQASQRQTVTLKGASLKGMQMNAVDDHGNHLNFQIKNVELYPEDPDKETYLYTVFYQDPNDSQWKNLCEPDIHHVAKAIPLQGSWDETGNYIPSNTTMTFGCTSGAIGKCVLFGYKPWKVVQGRSLRDLHQACTRMVRADYCGDGKGHTRDGTPIDVYDTLEIEKRTPKSGMAFEAAWQPNGAAFVNRSRWSEASSDLLHECPEKLKHRINLSNTSMAPETIQKDFPDALLFNDSIVRHHPSQAAN